MSTEITLKTQTIFNLDKRLNNSSFERFGLVIRSMYAEKGYFLRGDDRGVADQVEIHEDYNRNSLSILKIDKCITDYEVLLNFDSRPVSVLVDRPGLVFESTLKFNLVKGLSEAHEALIKVYLTELYEDRFLVDQVTTTFEKDLEAFLEYTIDMPEYDLFRCYKLDKLIHESWIYVTELQE
jgi:hypothetical protein